MIKCLFFFLLFCCLSRDTSGQSSTNKILYVIDSIPIIDDLEQWDQVLDEDIADMTIVTNKDTLKLLGWEQLDGIAYIFTKEYRNRPDSLKKIPGLKQMKMKNGAWYFHGIPYTGKYIDYYTNGMKQNEGLLLNGQLNGSLIIYFKNGRTKLTAYYKQGLQHGKQNEYYKNGALMQTRNFLVGRDDRTGKTYFINGQVQYELRLKKETGYDTSVTFFSNGKIKKLQLIKDGQAVVSGKDDELNFYTTQFNQGINTANLKEANRWFFKRWQLDSTSIENYFNGGLLFFKESRFDDAIAEFDKALKVEPLMREALLYRGLARIHKYTGSWTNKVAIDPFSAGALARIPAGEQEKICEDLLLADEIDFSDLYVKKKVPERLLNHCSKKNNLSGQ